MKLISDSEWLEIRSALKDVKDTFFIVPVIGVIRRTRLLSGFHESRPADLQPMLYDLKGLVIYRTTTDDGQVLQSAQGFMDLAEGYINFNYQEFQELSLINADGQCIFIANQDTLIAFGQELTIIGIDLVGPTEADFQVVKVQFKKNLVNDSEVKVSGPLVSQDGSYTLQPGGFYIKA